MPRIKLAHWHGGHAPGEELNVTDDDLRALERDGRVAEVVKTEPAQTAPAPAVELDAEAPAPETGRKRR